MEEYFYTYLDDYEVVHYGVLNAQSEEHAEKQVKEQYGRNTPAEIWNRQKPPLEKSRSKCNILHWSPYFYNAFKSKKTKLVYSWPRDYIWLRIFFILFAAGSMISGGIFVSIEFSLVFYSLSFVPMILQYAKTVFITKEDSFIKFKKRILIFRKQIKFYSKARNLNQNLGAKRLTTLFQLEKIVKRLSYMVGVIGYLYKSWPNPSAVS